MTWPFHLANALVLISFAVKEILWLRLVTVVAGIAVLGAMWHADGFPPRAAFLWQLLFFAINFARLAQLIHERRPVHLPPDANRLAKSVFAHLRPRQLLRLLALGEIHEHPPGGLVIRQGKSLAHLAIVIDGTARVKLGDGERVVDLSYGAFVGELSYLTGLPPAADVVAVSPLRLVRWPIESLRGYLAANPEIRSAMQVVLGIDLAAKLRGRALRTPS